MSATPPAPADQSWGAFTAHAPWVLDRDRIAWLPSAERLRAAARAEVPQLTTPSRFPGTRVVIVASRLTTALLPWFIRKRRQKYGTPEASRADISLRLRKAAERLGPTYIKLGQIISSGEG